jgi:predicted outer membrane repeat protein
MGLVTVTTCGSDNAGGGTNLASALAQGGRIEFSCRVGSRTIRITRRHELVRSVEIDGADQVVLDGARATTMFSIPAGVTLTLRRLELRGGASQYLTLRGSRVPNGGVASGRGEIALHGVRTKSSRNPYDVLSISVAERSTFEDNFGAWVVRARRAQLTDTVFNGNEGAPLVGPTLYGTTPATATLERIEVNGGGRPLRWDGELLIRKSRFTNNGNAQIEGGALSAGGRTTVEATPFVNNRARAGGAIWVRGGKLEVRGSLFEGNRAETAGGAVGAATIASPIELRLFYSKFRRNAGRVGGAVSLQSRPGPSINRLLGGPLLFSSNEAVETGGAIHAAVGRIELARAVFVENRAGISGGAILGTHTGSGWVRLGNALFVRNEAPTGGAFFGRMLDLRNSTVVANRGGGVVATPLLPTTPSGRTGENLPDLGFANDFNIALVNTIIARNDGGNCAMTAGVRLNSRGNNLQYPGVDCGTSIPSADPMLDSYYVPEPASPARGAGQLPICTTDRLVKGRDVYGGTRPESERCAIGAVERSMEKHATRLLRQRRELPESVRRFLERFGVLRRR